MNNLHFRRGLRSCAIRTVNGNLTLFNQEPCHLPPSPAAGQGRRAVVIHQYVVMSFRHPLLTLCKFHSRVWAGYPFPATGWGLLIGSRSRTLSTYTGNRPFPHKLKIAPSMCRYFVRHIRKLYLCPGAYLVQPDQNPCFCSLITDCRKIGMGVANRRPSCKKPNHLIIAAAY